MLVTTREGNAILFTESIAADGFAIPPGKTAIIPPDLKPILKDIDSQTAQKADDLLAGLEDPFASSPVLAGSGTATLGTGSSINAGFSSPGGQSTLETPTGISNEGSSYVSPDGKQSMAKPEVWITLGAQ